MTHPNSPEYWTITSIDEYDGSPTCLGVYENMDAVSYRLKALYSHCGSEYRIECFHLQTADHCSEQYNEQLVNRRKYQKEEADLKEKAAKYDELKKFSQDTTEFTEEETEQLIEDLEKS